MLAATAFMDCCEVILCQQQMSFVTTVASHEVKVFCKYEQLSAICPTSYDSASTWSYL